jgi:translocation and assembly module TamA
VESGRVPVRVTLHEAPEKRIQLSANFSTDSGLGGSVGYQNRNFLDRAWRFGTRLDLQQRLQTVDATIGLPERRGGWADQYALRLRHTDIENLDTREASIGWRRSSIEERRQPHYGITLAFSEQRADRVLDESVHATYLYYGYTWRTTDNLLSPRRGTITQVEAGIAPPGVSTRAFGRTIGRVAWYHPLGPQRDLLVQLHGGAVIAGSSSGIPQQFLFRTGGSTTVRGYDLDSLGVQRGAAVLGGRTFALASVEATQWITEQIGIALFLDAGNAADRFRDLRPAYGIGAGARVRTPLGPFRLDLAYGEKRDSWRLHFSIGLSF